MYVQPLDRIGPALTHLLGDFCSKRSIRCQPNDEDTERCKNCADFNVPCTYHRPKRKRGQKPQNQASTSQQQSQQLGPGLQSSGHFPRAACAHLSELDEDNSDNSDDQISIARAWKAFAVASTAQVDGLLQIYFDICYPMYCILAIDCYCVRC